MGKFVKKSMNHNNNNEDLNRNNLKLNGISKRNVCDYCHKVITNKNVHEQSCVQKEYIMSSANQASPEIKTVTQQNTGKGKSALKKIDVQQNIVVNGSGSYNGNVTPLNTFSNKQNGNQLTTDFKEITRRLANNSVTITKQPKDRNSMEVDPEIENKDEEKLTCSKCRADFKTVNELSRHQSTHYQKIRMAMSEVEKFFDIEDRSKCPICQKPMNNTQKSAFKKHLITHSNEMKYACNVCRVRFRRLDHMKIHMKRHS